jgi:hypothetical protein
MTNSDDSKLTRSISIGTPADPLFPHWMKDAATTPPSERHAGDVAIFWAGRNNNGHVEVVTRREAWAFRLAGWRQRARLVFGWRQRARLVFGWLRGNR